MNALHEARRPREQASHDNPRMHAPSLTGPAPRSGHPKTAAGCVAHLPEARRHKRRPVEGGHVSSDRGGRRQRALQAQRSP